MSIVVIKAGINDSIQDDGRFGFAKFGINNSGAMDKLALMTANALVGNELATAAFELYFPAATFRFETDVLIALSGADFSATIELPNTVHISLDTNRAALIKAGSIISFNKKLTGECCYLAVHGGFKLDKWMGSHSTQLSVAQGGYNGRRLKKDDHIELCQSLSSTYNLTKLFPWKAAVYTWYEDAATFNVLKGPEWDCLMPIAKKHFLSKSFKLSAQSDRMGARLDGLPLVKKEESEMISSGVSFGSIQLLPNGQLIILMADHPTTGGYPRIANIISAHLPKLAQTSAGAEIHFGITEIGIAENLMILQESEIKQLQSAVKFQLVGLI